MLCAIKFRYYGTKNNFSLLMDFLKLSKLLSGRMRNAEASASIQFLAVPCPEGRNLAEAYDASLLLGKENVVIFAVGQRAFKSECWITIDLPVTPQGRTDVYSRLAQFVGKYQIRQAAAAVNDARGLVAAIAAADITAAPMALILTNEHPFLSDRDNDLLLTEAIDKARMAFSQSVSLCELVLSNFGKRLWLLPARANSAGRTDRVIEPHDKEILSRAFADLIDGFPKDEYLQQISRSAELGDTVPYADPSAPTSIHWVMHDCFRALYRLAQTGYRPDFIVDVGAATGFWSHVASQLFPKSRFYLIEPLLERYQKLDKTIYSLHPEFITIASAAGDKLGEMDLNISPDLYSSSFLDGAETSPDRHWDQARVPVRTLDEISSTLSIAGRGLLKIDVQLAEHLVLDGASRFLAQVDVIHAELSLSRFAATSKTMFEMITRLHDLGFEYFDYAGAWRSSKTGRMIQQDTLFMRSSLPY